MNPRSNKIWLRLVSLTLITAMLCQDAAFALNDLSKSKDSLQAESAFAKGSKASGTVAQMQENYRQREASEGNRHKAGSLKEIISGRTKEERGKITYYLYGKVMFRRLINECFDTGRFSEAVDIICTALEMIPEEIREGDIKKWTARFLSKGQDELAGIITGHLEARRLHVKKIPYDPQPETDAVETCFDTGLFARASMLAVQSIEARVSGLTGERICGWMLTCFNKGHFSAGVNIAISFLKSKSDLRAEFNNALEECFEYMKAGDLFFTAHNLFILKKTMDLEAGKLADIKKQIYDLFAKFRLLNEKLDEERRFDEAVFQKEYLPLIYILEFLLPGSIRYIAGLLAMSKKPQLLIRFLDLKKTALLNKEVAKALVEYADKINNRSKRTKYKVDLTMMFKLLNIINALLETGNEEEIISELKGLLAESDIAEFCNSLTRKLLTAIAASLELYSRNVDINAFSKIYMPFVYRLSKAIGWIKTTRPDRLFLFKKVLEAMFKDNFWDFIENEEQSDTTGRQLARHNRKVREEMVKKGIDVKKWLGRDKKERFNAAGINYKDVKNFTIRPILREPGHDLFIGDFTDNCIAMSSIIHPEAIVERLTDEGINIIEVIDRDRERTMACLWLYIAEDGSLVIQNMEMDAEYFGNIDLAEKIVEEIINYAIKFAEYIGAKRVLMGISKQGKFQENGFTAKRYGDKLIDFGMQKIGGYFEGEYYLDSAGAEKAYLVWEKNKHGEMYFAKPASDRNTDEAIEISAQEALNIADAYFNQTIEATAFEWANFVSDGWPQNPLREFLLEHMGDIFQGIIDGKIVAHRLPDGRIRFSKLVEMRCEKPEPRIRIYKGGQLIKECNTLGAKEFSELDDVVIRMNLDKNGILTLGGKSRGTFTKYPDLPVEIYVNNGVVVEVKNIAEQIIVEEYILFYREGRLYDSIYSNLYPAELKKLDGVVIRKRLDKNGMTQIGGKHFVYEKYPYHPADFLIKDGVITEVKILGKSDKLVDADKLAEGGKKEMSLIYDEKGNLIDSYPSDLYKKRMMKLDNVRIRRRIDSQGRISIGDRLWASILGYAGYPFEAEFHNGVVTKITVLKDAGRLIDAKEIIEQIELMLVYKDGILVDSYYEGLSEKRFQKLNGHVVKTRLDQLGWLRIGGRNRACFTKYGNYPVEADIKNGVVTEVRILKESSSLIDTREVIENGIREFSLVFNSDGVLVDSYFQEFSEAKFKKMESNTIIARLDQWGNLTIGGRLRAHFERHGSGVVAVRVKNGYIEEVDLLGCKNISDIKSLDQIKDNVLQDGTIEFSFIYDSVMNLLDTYYMQLKGEKMAKLKDNIIITRLTKDSSLTIGGINRGHFSGFSNCVIYVHIKNGLIIEVLILNVDNTYDVDLKKLREEKVKQKIPFKLVWDQSGNLVESFYSSNVIPLRFNKHVGKMTGNFKVDKYNGFANRGKCYYFGDNVDYRGFIIKEIVFGDRNSPGEITEFLIYDEKENKNIRVDARSVLQKYDPGELIVEVIHPSEEQKGKAGFAPKAMRLIGPRIFTPEEEVIKKEEAEIVRQIISRYSEEERELLLDVAIYYYDKRSSELPDGLHAFWLFNEFIYEWELVDGIAEEFGVSRGWILDRFHEIREAVKSRRARERAEIKWRVLTRNGEQSKRMPLKDAFKILEAFLESAKDDDQCPHEFTGFDIGTKYPTKKYIREYLLNLIRQEVGKDAGRQTIVALRLSDSKIRFSKLHEMMRMDEGISIEQVFPEDWEEVKDGIIRLYHMFYDEYGVKREKEETIEALFKEGDFIYIVAKKEGKIIGFIEGCPLEILPQAPGVSGDRNLGQRNTIYIGSFFVERRGQGIGAMMRNKFHEVSESLGYKYIARHAKKEIAEKMGYQILSECPNWGKTGQVFVYCRQALVSNYERMQREDILAKLSLKYRYYFNSGENLEWNNEKKLVLIDAEDLTPEQLRLIDTELLRREREGSKKLYVFFGSGINERIVKYKEMGFLKNMRGADLAIDSGEIQGNFAGAIISHAKQRYSEIFGEEISNDSIRILVSESRVSLWQEYLGLVSIMSGRIYINGKMLDLSVRDDNIPSINEEALLMQVIRDEA